MQDKATEAESFNEPESSFKIIMVGPYGSGKTSLLARMTGQGFSENTESTIGASFVSQGCCYSLCIGNSVMPMKFTELFWDTAGQERFAMLLPSYLRDADAVVIAFDGTRFDDSTDLLEWLRRISETALQGPPAVLVAVNKADLLDAGEWALWTRWCANMNIDADKDPKLDCVRVWSQLKAFVTSAKTGEGVASLHDCLQRALSLKLLQGIRDRESTRVLIQPGAAPTCTLKEPECC